MVRIKVANNIGNIEGLTIIVPEVFEDKRGYLMESFNASDLAKVGITDIFVQDNEAFSKTGVLRGFHVNRFHPQARKSQIRWRV